MKLLLTSKFNEAYKKVPLQFSKPHDALKVIAITTAANVYAPEEKTWLYEEMQPLADMGMQPQEYDIAGKSAADVVATLAGADIVYVSGGNTYYLLEQMQKCQFAKALQPVLAAGALYIGCSAGAVAACPSIDFIGKMDDPSKATLADFSGLNLVPFHVLVHTDHHKYGPIARAIATDKANSSLNLMGLRDNQALLVTDNYVEFF